mgnify:CR=1 FL=1
MAMVLVCLQEGLSDSPLLPEDARACRMQTLAGALGAFLQRAPAHVQ